MLTFPNNMKHVVENFKFSAMAAPEFSLASLLVLFQVMTCLLYFGFVFLCMYTDVYTSTPKLINAGLSLCNVACKGNVTQREPIGKAFFYHLMNTYFDVYMIIYHL